MVQIISDEYGGNVFGRLGKGIGKGLSEQIPKEIERGRLSHALTSMKKNPDMDPIDRLRSLYGAGATPEQISQIEPYLKRAAIQKRGQGQRTGVASTQQAGGGATQVSNQPANAPVGQQMAPGGSSQNALPSQPTISNAGNEAAGRQAVYVPSPQDIENESFRLMELDPNLYDTYEKAFNQANRNLSYPSEVQVQNIAANERQIEQQGRLDKDFSDQINAKLGDTVSGLQKNLPGETIDRLRAKAEREVLLGKSEKNAVRDSVQEALELGKAANDIENNIGTRNFFGKASNKLISDIKSAKKPFEKADELELFKNLQKQYLDIGDHLASLNTWTPNAQLQKDIAGFTEKESPEKMAAIISRDLTNQDSLFSLGYLLYKSDLDDASVMNQIQKMSNEGTIELNARQQRELSDYYSLHPTQPNLGDILWDSTVGLGGLSGLVGEYITGTKRKVGRIQRLKQSLGKE